MDKKLVKASKFMSLVLRHKPEEIGLELDPNGWANLHDLIKRSKGVLNPQIVSDVVAQNDKKRFAISDDGQRIRASQGHSISVDLNLKPMEPPNILYHGTATRFLDSIRQQGLISGRRQHVHLSKDRETATKVGMRHGKPTILTIQAADMHALSFQFFLSENGVWLTEHVPLNFIDFE